MCHSARVIRLLLPLVLICSGMPLSLAAEAGAGSARQAWQMLDYIAVDYAGAVRDGQVVEAGEYAEMHEFAAVVRTQLAALPPAPQQPQLLAAAADLVAAVAAKAQPEAVAAQARALARDLMAQYPFAAVPVRSPDLARGAQLYVEHCSSCHGVNGHGDGPAAASLNPRPVAFSEPSRAAQRTPMAFFEVLSQGVPGTAMKAFNELPEAERWALAFHAGGLAYTAAQRSEGESSWRADETLHARIPTLEALTRISEADLVPALGAARAGTLIAYLRANPRAVAGSVSGGPAAAGDTGPLALARQRMAESQRVYTNGNAAAAASLALSAYLDGVEPVEPLLATRDAALLREIEAAMGQFRSLLGKGAAPAPIDEQAQRVSVLFDRAEAVLQGTHTDAATAFLASFTILVREGLEALLIVIGMIAFLRKAGRGEVLRYVHAGWIGALLAGLATWAAATYLVDISGANREVTEGVSALFAAAVLLSVGIWMHQKSLAGRWQEYLHAKMSAALTRRSAFFLFSLAFIAVYREVFETILFYIAMWSEQGASAILAGLGAGIVVLAVIAYAMLRMSRRLPIGRFFSLSSIFIAILAVILVGKGVAALQEAGWLPQALVQAPRIDWLGIYPTLQSLTAQLVVAVAAVAGFILNARSTPTRSGKP